MPLPIIIILERHWDELVKKAQLSLIPELAQIGYDSLGIEAPHTLSNDEILDNTAHLLEFYTEEIKVSMGSVHNRHHLNISQEELMEMDAIPLTHFCMQYIFSKFCNASARMFREYKAQSLYSKLLHNLKPLGITLHGLDVANDFKASGNIFNSDLGHVIAQTLPERDKCIHNEIFKLYAQKQGLIVVLGSGHYQALRNFVIDKKFHNIIFLNLRSSKEWTKFLDMSEIEKASIKQDNRGFITAQDFLINTDADIYSMCQATKKLFHTLKERNRLHQDVDLAIATGLPYKKSDPQAVDSQSKTLLYRIVKPRIADPKPESITQLTAEWFKLQILTAFLLSLQ